MLLQPPHGPVTHAADDAHHRLLGRSSGVVEAHAAVLDAREYAVQRDGVEMEVQVQAAAEALDEVDRTVLGP
jgi:dihydroxyacetone kinase